MGKINSFSFIRRWLICFALLSFLSFLNISYIYAGSVKGISSDAETYRAKGYDAQQRGDMDTAIEWYQKAASIKPAYASPHNDLGILFETKGWLDRAEAEYTKALAINPNYKEVHTNIALLYERKGELEKAAFHWMRRYKLGSPSDPWTDEAKNRLEKLGLLDKVEKAIPPKIEKKTPIGEPKEKKKSVNIKETKSVKEYVKEKQKPEPEPIEKYVEEKPEPMPNPKKVSGWTRIGLKKNTKEEVLASKPNKDINKELKESLRLAEERLKKERASIKKPAETMAENSSIPKGYDAAQEEKIKELTNVRSQPVSSSGFSYNKAKDYYNKGEYAKALDAIRLAKQDSKGDKPLLELEDEIKFKMKEERIEDHYKEGMIRYRQKDFMGSRKEFEAIMSILPE